MSLKNKIDKVIHGQMVRTLFSIQSQGGRKASGWSVCKLGLVLNLSNGLKRLLLDSETWCC